VWHGRRTVFISGIRRVIDDEEPRAPPASTPDDSMLIAPETK
jgi:hypothetical protein